MNNYLVHFCGKIFFQMTSKPEGVKNKIYICYFKLSAFLANHIIKKGKK